MLFIMWRVVAESRRVKAEAKLFILVSLVGCQNAAEVLELCRKPLAQIFVVLEENLQPLQLHDGLQETHAQVTDSKHSTCM